MSKIYNSNSRFDLISNRIKYGTDGGINVDAGALYVNGINGRVGINTISPQANLDISGTIRTNSTISSSGIMDISGYYDVNGMPINNSFYPALSTATTEKAITTFTSQSGWPTSLNLNPNRNAWSPTLGLFAVTVPQGIGRVLTSPDGVNWTNRTTGVNLTNCNNGSGNTITCSSTVGISAGMTIRMVSGTGSIPGSQTTISSVTDLSSFVTTATVTGLSNSTINADSAYFGIIWCSDLSGVGMFIASRTSGSDMQIITSVDGINWIARTTPTGFNDPHMFSYSPQLKRVICGRTTTGSTAFIYSDDGINWTTVTNPVPSNLFFDSDWSPELGLFCSVAFSGDNQKIITSRDGITWTPIILNVPTSSTWNAVKWSPELGIFCALSTDYSPNVIVSSDGINWEFYSTPSVNQYRSLTWSPQLRIFTAVSQTGTNRFAYSYNGKSWLEKNIGTSSNYRGISWSPELGIFLINGQVGTNIILTSYFGGRPPTSFNIFDSSFNNINQLGLWNFQSFGRGIPVRKTGNFTVQPGENWIICNGTGTITVTLPTASSWTGEEIMIKTIQAQLVSSNASNVIQLNGSGPSNSILSATIGKWATLVSDGSNWIITDSN